MRIHYKIPVKKNLMKLTFLAVLFLLATSCTFSQATDSAYHFLQKGVLEKQNGRRMESLKQFEKAIKYDAGNKTVLTELASAYLELRKYHNAIKTYKKLEEAWRCVCHQLQTIADPFP